MKEEREKRLVEAGLLSSSSDGAIAIVRISFDDAEDLSEHYLVPDDSDTSSDPLFTKLDPYFSIYEDETVNMELIQSQVLPAYEKGCDAVGGMCPHVSFATLRQHAAAGNLQTIDLDTIRVYYDDSAALKNRPLNARASSLVSNSSSIHGDVFLARITESGRGYESLKAEEAAKLIKSQVEGLRF